jgi:hypothetical protein
MHALERANDVNLNALIKGKRMIVLNELQKAIGAFLIERVPALGAAQLLEFALAGGSARYRAAHTLVGDPAEQVRVVYSIPQLTNHVFFALTLGQPMDVASLLANLEEYEHDKKSALVHGEVVITPHDPFWNGKHAPHAIILLLVDVADDLVAIPGNADIGGQQITFSLAVPLSKEETDHLARFGHDALIDLFQETGKELFF